MRVLFDHVSLYLFHDTSDRACFLSIIIPKCVVSAEETKQKINNGFMREKRGATAEFRKRDVRFYYTI